MFFRYCLTDGVPLPLHFIPQTRRYSQTGLTFQLWITDSLNLSTADQYKSVGKLPPRRNLAHRRRHVGASRCSLSKPKI